MERRLSAILVADVVGYSRLMERDEGDAFERLRAHRKELFAPEIEKHHGRVFKLTGDGLLAEFASVVDAVECAVALQRGMAERNSGLTADQRIDVRIGINLGDVIIEGEDRHGEGVNVAARLQQLADPGGTAVSQTVADHVKHKLALRFQSLGEQRVENIAEPVSVYRVLMDPVPAPTGSRRRHAQARPMSIVFALALVLGAGIAWHFWTPRPTTQARRPAPSS
jgi:adenylate cyclase